MTIHSGRAPRLASDVFIRACVRRADLEGIACYVTAKGDPTSGAILVKQRRRDGTALVLAETLTPDGERGWYRGTGPAPVAEQAADDYIQRARHRDPDLWVIELDDAESRLPFDARIVEG